jgi:MFS family permease
MAVRSGVSETPTLPSRELFKVVAVSCIGTTLEFFDFVAAGVAAAIVWPIVFFPSHDFATSVLISISVYILGFFARPLGAFMFGHVGDRRGRKYTMIVTLILMGLGSLGIAFTPAYTSWGILSGALVTLFRLIQGFGLGGEFGGGSSWVVEVAAASKSKWRGFWGSWMGASSAYGTLLSSATFALVVSVYGGARSSAFLDMGWRVPFIFGALIAVFGLIIRMKTLESPIFKALQQRKAIEKVPGVKAFKEMPLTIIFLSFARFSSSALIYIVSVFSMSYISMLSQDLASIGPSTIMVGSIVYSFFILAGGALGDRIGRRPAILLASTLITISLVPYFTLLNTKSILVIYLAQIMMYMWIGLAYGNAPVFVTESFPTRYRYSGASVSYELSAFMGALNPILMSYILTLFPSAIVGWPYMIIPTFGFLALCFIGVLKLPETRNKPLD